MQGSQAVEVAATCWHCTGLAYAEPFACEYVAVSALHSDIDVVPFIYDDIAVPFTVLTRYYATHQLSALSL